MLDELFIGGELCSYNTKIADVLGIIPSIYLSALTRLKSEQKSRKSIKQNKDRIKELSCLSVKDQNDSLRKLSECNILIVNKDESIEIDMDTLYRLFIQYEKKEAQQVKSQMKVTKESIARDRKTCILEAVKRHVPEYTNNIEELNIAYSSWLQMVSDKYDFVNNELLQRTAKIVDDFACHDLDKAIDLLNFATSYTYQNMKNAVEKYAPMNVQSGVHCTIDEPENGPDIGVY